MKKARLETLSPESRLRVLRYVRGHGREANMYDHVAAKRREAIGTYVKTRETGSALQTDWMGEVYDPAAVHLGSCVNWQKLALSHLREMRKPVLP